MCAVARTWIRIKRFRRVHADDGFVFFAVICLIAGTALLYIDIPYIYTQLNVEAGTETPPADYIDQLLYDEKIQDAAVVLIFAALLSVKFAFLFLFRGLIRRVRWFKIWWWCVLTVLIPSTGYCVLTNFVMCPFFNSNIFGMQAIICLFFFHTC